MGTRPNPQKQKILDLSACIIYAVFVLQVGVSKAYLSDFDHCRLQIQKARHLLIIFKEKINNSLLSNSGALI